MQQPRNRKHVLLKGGIHSGYRILHQLVDVVAEHLLLELDLGGSAEVRDQVLVGDVGVREGEGGEGGGGGSAGKETGIGGVVVAVVVFYKVGMENDGYGGGYTARKEAVRIVGYEVAVGGGGGGGE